MRPIRQIVIDHGKAFVLCEDGTLWICSRPYEVFAGKVASPEWTQIDGPPDDEMFSEVEPERPFRLSAAERSEVQFVQPPKSFPDEFDF